MQSLLDIAPCGYISFKDNGEIVWTNQTLCGWLNYSKNTLSGEKIERIFTIATRIFYNTHFYPLLKLHTKAEEIFLTLTTSDGKDFPVMANAERREEEGIHINHCVFIPLHQRTKYEEEILKAKRDAENAVRENKHLQELRQSLEAKTLELEHHFQRQMMMNQNLVQFSKIISHDLQEPLHKIQLFADMIFHADSSNLSERSISSLKKIQLAADRLRLLTNGLQQYVSTESDKLYSDVDLLEVVNAAHAKVVTARNFSDFDLTLPKFPIIQGYRNQLELLFFHLIDNAVQFREMTRKLKIEMSVVAFEENIYKVNKDKYKYVNHIRITFKDNGIGFDNTYKDYVFELLKKIDATKSGLGIGLALIKKVTENHNGSLSVNSSEGVGTEFTLILPVNLKEASS
jgi:phosphoserine phosphatase RsbU/P